MERSGAFWQDRYHATAVETESHLRSYLTCIGLNVVRAGIAARPRVWADSSHFELRGLNYIAELRQRP